MRILTFTLLVCLSLSNAFAENGGVGGGPRMTAKSVSIPKDQISDIRLKNGSVVPLKDLMMQRNNGSSIKETSTAIKFGFSKSSPVADIQLVSGDIIDLIGNSNTLSGDGDSGGN